MPFPRRHFLATLLAVPAWAAKPHAEIALAGGKIYPSPTLPSILDAVVILREGRIAAVGPLSKIRIPTKALVVDCRGAVVVAGFTNCFADPATPAAFEAQTTRWGFTSVFAMGLESDPAPWLRRIETGEVAGPWIRRATTYSATKTPEAVPADALWIPNPHELDTETLRAAAAEAHRQRKTVLAHPITPESLADCLQAGIDVLVHPPDAAPALLRKIIDRRVAVIPSPAAGWNQLRPFSTAGGQILFSTTGRDPAAQYQAFAEAGLSTTQILAALTANPAARFGDKLHGQLAPGFLADVNVLSADPAADARNFAAVRLSLRQGRVLHKSG